MAQSSTFPLYFQLDPRTVAGPVVLGHGNGEYDSNVMSSLIKDALTPDIKLLDMAAIAYELDVGFNRPAVDKIFYSRADLLEASNVNIRKCTIGVDVTTK
ncbi:hypothetical protein GOP47_0014646 [Adiantum capillus-veneris]|uniref:Uncharacterized protein n=1 Tax=Adiantum capillus-veneris TaxID=13818 RepID=A0A9D4ULV9_ADICA|nr:hypothetical protein GOP47_0014646 [Adiantum capillus-veneris]